MDNIYVYQDDFERNNVIDRVNCIADKLAEERNKPVDERDFDRERELIYAQFIQGLKLSTGNNLF